MISTFYRSVMATILLTLILCGAYPLIVYGLGAVLYSDNSNGSLIYKGEKVVGSKLIGQVFTRPEYFHGRPSAAGSAYDGAASSGTNLGPTNQKFADTIQNNVDAFLKENPAVKKGEIPTQIVTASASGLDPHVSPEAALVQLDRVASARQTSAEAVRNLVSEHTVAPQWGLFGEPVVNILLLNLALDEKLPLKR